MTGQKHPIWERLISGSFCATQECSLPWWNTLSFYIWFKLIEQTIKKESKIRTKDWKFQIHLKQLPNLSCHFTILYFLLSILWYACHTIFEKTLFVCYRGDTLTESIQAPISCIHTRTLTYVTFLLVLLWYTGFTYL